jgi:hypothetical protein
VSLATEVDCAWLWREIADAAALAAAES